MAISENNSSPIDGGFLQSPEWEKFQNEIGRKAFRINEGDFTCLAIEHKLPIVGGYFFVPRGPIMSVLTDEIINHKLQITKNRLNINKFLEKLINIAKEKDVNWIRVEPQSFKDLEKIKKSLGIKYKIKKSKKDHEPAQTLMIDLLQNEEEILAAMKPKTRYNIKLSEKKGVKFYASIKREAIGNFLKLMEETARREGITNHSDDYYRAMIEIIPEENIQLILAEFKNRIIAGAIIIFYGGVATYLHGASSSEQRNLMAPFGVQWTAIKMAQKSGCEKYDFGGVSLETEKYKKAKKTWAGITRFKSGFCPNNAPVEFPGCWDIVLNNKRYWLYRFLQGIKELF